MLRDKAKLKKVKWSQDDLRGVWCLGVHSTDSVDNIKNLVEFCAKAQKIEIKTAHIFTRQIGRTNYSVTLF